MFFYNITVPIVGRDCAPRPLSILCRLSQTCGREPQATGFPRLPQCPQPYSCSDCGCHSRAMSLPPMDFLPSPPSDAGASTWSLCLDHHHTPRCAEPRQDLTTDC